MFQSGFAALHDQAKPAFGGGVVLFARGLLLAFIVVAGGLAESPPAAADEAPVAFIRALGTQALSVIRSDTLPVEKAAYFRQMIHQDFDLTGMCRFVLGPDWRIASPAERRQFRSLFTDRLVRHLRTAAREIRRRRFCRNRQQDRSLWRHRDKPNHPCAGCSDRRGMAARNKARLLQDRGRRHRSGQHGIGPTHRDRRSDRARVVRSRCFSRRCAKGDEEVHLGRFPPTGADPRRRQCC
jgi:hypothetical protein